MDNSLWLDNFLNMYRELGTDNFDVLKTVYHPNIEFQDPLHHVSGIAALTHYFDNIYTQVTSCNFHIEHTFEVNGEASVYWTMHFVHKQLNGQKPIEVQGHSHLKMLDDQVIYHRDYLDVGSMLYEHIPVLGCVIKSIKKRASR
ncbi:putative transcriptional regulator [Vibrio chagasii]|uniref:nuclear transport factor 2 family protein n=1 Tax=Vibrio sp. 070316B TaxID=2607608 RepID=UPI0014935B3D|nr:nuclear transport factor 2 family protein [Vibrio sp. 070316B]CAH6834395.1 putative transcriptional regulator [Vibrio chagasii]NOI37513.1 nuclear transport factor 2 family protein [Vibrio sp. 070316B]CAH6914266.1 putative transcriptional regulator [Vibrio chagasii]CAH7049511.1 putative transcriptional regulator [Vibrio chagasii]CAH7068071.1 putative transcriptional regulator [Vibrio chagasii]